MTHRNVPTLPPVTKLVPARDLPAVRLCADSKSEGTGADDAEGKVALVLEHGLRADRAAAENLVTSVQLRGLTLADYQQRIEVLSMYGWPLASVYTATLYRPLAQLLPRLAYVATLACVPRRLA